MKLKFLTLVTFCCTLFVFTSCDKDDPEIPNEEEVITNVTYVLTPASGDIVTLTFSDLDGDGGNAPIITGGTLKANTSYTGIITLTNATETPAEDITEEIMEEDDEHQFFFEVSGANLSIEYNDEDGDGNPVGLNTTVTAGSTSSGTMTVTLRHEPSKDAAGVKEGDITNAGGETDIEIEFPIEVIE